MKALLGTKRGMTRVFTEDGRQVGVTVVEVGPCVVTQVKTARTDGYEAVQIAYGPVEARKAGKALIGHFGKAGKGTFRHVREVRGAGEGLALGSELTAGVFAKGDRVDVTGKSKGRGFAGVFKRFNFGGGKATHGSMFHRAPGSIGMRQDPGKVAKGKKLPGHMGDKRVTTRNLEVVEVLADKGVLLIRGSVPGAPNGLVFVQAAG
ncbi:MAG: 50S ribosomal protein L3 [Candidatus Methylomirabilis sp.]|nr:50S ribosomal protein L3 [Deltaproteobacteria bacterium]